MSDKYLYDGLDALEIAEMQELQKNSLALLTTMVREMVEDGLRKNVIINFNGCGDEGFFELDPFEENDGNYAELIEFVHNRNYLLDHAKSSHAEGRFVFDWMSNLLTSCIPGWETIDTSGSIYIELEDTDRFRIGLEVNIYNESSEIPNEFSFDWDLEIEQK